MSKPQPGYVLPKAPGGKGTMSKVSRTTHRKAPAKRYAVMPLEILRDHGLSDAAKLLYCELDGRVTSKGQQQVRQDTVAANLGWSLRKVQRASAELVGAGLITVRRTRASSVYSVINPVRHTQKPAKPSVPDAGNTSSVPVTDGGSQPENVTDGGPDTSPVAGTYRNTKLRNKNKQKNRTYPQKADTYDSNSADVAAEILSQEKLDSYLEAIYDATNHRIESNRLTNPMIHRIAAAGITPQDTAQLVAAQLAANNGKVSNPPGFIAKVILPGLAEKPQPEPSPTPLPSPAEIAAAPRCDHGAELGRCAICRNQENQKQSAAPDPDRCGLLLDEMNMHIDTYRETGNKVAYMKAIKAGKAFTDLPTTTTDHAEALMSWLTESLQRAGAA